MHNEERSGKWDLDPLDPAVVTISVEDVIEEKFQELDRLAIGVLKVGMTDPRYYNCSKEARGYLEGRKILSKSQGPMTQNNFLIVASEEEAENILERVAERKRQKQITAGNPGGTGIPAGGNQERPAVLVPASHEDL
jgi:hypothetical protein